MANSKHAHLRYNILDYCFRNKPLSFDELLSHLNNLISEYYPGEGIATRTLYNDIKTFKDPIEGFGAPLLIRAGKYIYSDSNFSIATKPLLPYENYLNNTFLISTSSWGFLFDLFYVLIVTPYIY